MLRPYTNVGPSPLVRDTRWETRLLALVAAVLVVFGLTAVYGASSLLTISGGQVGSSFALKQALGAAVGGIVAALLARSDYRKWQRAAWPVLGVVAVLLLLPLLPFTQAIAPSINGARRWVNLGFVTVQPSELAKFAVVVWTAMLAAKKGERIRTFQYGLLPFLVVLVPLVALIFLEPNLSMAVLVTLLAGVVLFTAGARIGHFLTIAVVATPILFGAVASAQYRLARVVTFLNPGSAPSEATWQVHQSLVGMGAGRLFGVGLGQGQQKLGYLPYAYSDFIFSTIGEEWGFLGVLAIMVLFGTFAWLGLRIARSAGDPFGRLLAVGLTGMIGITAVLHIGVTLALLPATGITLPFISYGRSSLLLALVATGGFIRFGRAGRAVGRVLEPERPVIVIGTGGYAAGPVVWRAQRRGLPTVLQEQNASPGLATRWLARRARQVHLGFPEARAELRFGPHTAVFALGNPIRRPEPGSRAPALDQPGLGAERPTLLALGGSQGAGAGNFAAGGALERGLLDGVNVVWGTGTAQANALARYAVPGRVVVRGFFDPIAAAYRVADLVVARAGAMTVAELCAWGKPSVLVPLPTSAANHQTHNARALAAAGAAIHLAEHDLSAHALAGLITELLGEPARLEALAARARARGHPNASREIVSRILTIVV